MTAIPSEQQSDQTEHQQMTGKAEEVEQPSSDIETPSAMTVGTLFAYPKVCRHIEQFQVWQKSRP